MDALKFAHDDDRTPYFAFQCAEHFGGGRVVQDQGTCKGAELGVENGCRVDVLRKGREISLTPSKFFRHST